MTIDQILKALPDNNEGKWHRLGFTYSPDGWIQAELLFCRTAIREEAPTVAEAMARVEFRANQFIRNHGIVLKTYES